MRAFPILFIKVKLVDTMRTGYRSRYSNSEIRSRHPSSFARLFSCMGLGIGA